MAELKSCPFCGKPVSMVYNSRDNAYKFYHTYTQDSDECYVYEPIMLSGLCSLASAADAWNRRAENG